MNIIDKLMKIDAGTLETPKAVHKMYVKKIGEELEFEIEAINAEKAIKQYVKVLKAADNESMSEEELICRIVGLFESDLINKLTE